MPLELTHLPLLLKPEGALILIRQERIALKRANEQASKKKKIAAKGTIDPFRNFVWQLQ
ncbi:MAG: hypothetical protein O7D30_07235 [Rickettsia endosymbiont of Ixodes persulcatus]|nr:hypothetical protein [Rickettsia endosymbiont of Ixodes persulcatus]